jgi:preprotein translocase subunit SecA
VKAAPSSDCPRSRTRSSPRRDEYAALSDEELQGKTAEFRARLEKGESLDDLLLEAFAVAREASYRVLGQKHYKVQIIGGASRCTAGNVAEMKTGEGKTLTCVLPAYLTALCGQGCSRRHRQRLPRQARLGVDGPRAPLAWPGPSTSILFRSKSSGGPAPQGLQLRHHVRDEQRVRLRLPARQHGDAHLPATSSAGLQHNYAIVDEVDSILIDEARTPLIISGPVSGSSQWFTAFARIVPKMTLDIHYEVDPKKKTVGVKEEGVEFVEDQLGIDNLYSPEHSQLVSYLNNAIKAKELFTKDKDYIVRKGEVVIVDEFTGRILDGRRYNEGMHQAIEAKEGVEIKNENQTLATVTLQNYFRLYDKLAGMTGTAETEAAELKSIYKLDVASIPTNKPNQRHDHIDLVYKTQEAKFEAVADDIAERVEKGQPVLVGTTSVERSEYLSKLLQARHIRHNVLNAKQHEKEAEFVAQAGRLGAVTVATNMAGRGTDIVLGGNPDIICDLTLRERGLDPVEDPEAYQEAWDEEIVKARRKSKEEAEKVCEVGGLYVLATERHESRRIDNQLRGRSARQGDPGETRFYLSMRDDLMTRFVGQTMENLMTRLNVPDDMPIDSKMVTNAIKGAQAQVENSNFEMRKNVLKYDEVLNEQRKVIYRERRQILEGEDIADNVRAMMDDTIAAYVDGATAEGYVEDWDLDELWSALDALYGPSVSYTELIDGSEYGSPGELTASQLLRALQEDAHKLYDELEESVTSVGGEDQMRGMERGVVLNVVDQKWREHLYEMDYLKEGIGLRAMAQRDPLVEYQREGGDMFGRMNDGIKEETIRQLFLVRKQLRQQKAEQGGPQDGPLNIDDPADTRTSQEQEQQKSVPKTIIGG